MTRIRTLQESDLDSVGEQTAELISDIVDPDTESFELGYSFELWVIDPDVETKTGSLDDVAKWSNRWHHQILSGQKAIAYAISVLEPGQPGPPIVGEVVESETAEKIQRAIKKIEKDEGSMDTSTLMLILQNYLVCTFWIRDARQVNVIDCPAVYRYLHPGELLTEDDFLNRLRREEPIIGRVK